MRRHFNDRLETGFKAHGGRIAGTGIKEDSYDEESFPDDRPFNRPLVTIWQKPIEVPVYPVKKYKISKKELEYYKNLKEVKKPDRKGAFIVDKKIRVITCSACERWLATLEGNKLTTKNEVEITGVAHGRKSGAYIVCKCGNIEEFIY